jgi:hypothetical protein
MRARSWSVAASVLIALTAATGTARAERPRIAVTGVGGESASAELRQRMSRAISDGLVASGADVVTAPGGIAYRVRGTLEVEGRTYILRLEMADAETGAIVEGREDRCEICTESEALETAGVAASALKAQVFKRRPAVAVAMPAASAPPNEADAPRDLGSMDIAASPSSEQSPFQRGAHPHRGLGAAGIAVGVLAATAGGYLLKIHHSGTCDLPDPDVNCQDRYNTRAGGIALLAGGGLALVGGVLAFAGVF